MDQNRILISICMGTRLLLTETEHSASGADTRLGFRGLDRGGDEPASAAA